MLFMKMSNLKLASLSHAVFLSPLIFYITKTNNVFNHQTNEQNLLLKIYLFLDSLALSFSGQD